MIINNQDIAPGHFYDDFVRCKQPILIKNAINSIEFKQLINDRKKEIKPLYSRGSVPFLYTYFDDPIIRKYLFGLPIIKHLICNNKTQFRNEMRLWHHDKGNISYFHYDQRSTDLLNICVSGSKQWLLLPPDAPLKCWPFYNIVLPFQKEKKKNAISLVMEQGDLLYIPRNWFHQVTTLEDHTLNINIIFNDLADNKMGKRELELAAIKRLFIPKYVYGDDIAVLNDAINKVSLLTILWRLLIELVPVVIITFILLYIVSILP